MHGQIAADPQKQDLIDLNSEDVDDAESWLLSPGAKSSIQSSPHSPQLSHRSTTASQAAGAGIITGVSPEASPRNPHPAQDSELHHALSQPSQLTPTTGASSALSVNRPPELVACHSPRPIQQARASRIPRLSSPLSTPAPSPMHSAARTAAIPSSPAATQTLTSPTRLGPRAVRSSRMPGAAGPQVTMPPANLAVSSTSIERQSSGSTASSSIVACTGLPSPFSIPSGQYGSKLPPTMHSTKGAPRYSNQTGMQPSSGLLLSPSGRAAYTAGGAIPTKASQGIPSKSSQAGSAMSSRSSSFRSSIPSAPNIAPPVFSSTASMPAALRDSAAWTSEAAAPAQLCDSTDAGVSAVPTTHASASGHPPVSADPTTHASSGHPPVSAIPVHVAAPAPASIPNAAAREAQAVCSNYSKESALLPGASISALTQEPSGAETAAAGAAAEPSRRRSSDGACVHLPPPPSHHRGQGQGSSSSKLAAQATCTSGGSYSSGLVQGVQSVTGACNHSGDGRESSSEGVVARHSSIPKAPSLGHASSGGEDLRHEGASGSGKPEAVNHANIVVATVHDTTALSMQGQLNTIAGGIHRSGSCASIAASTSSQAGRAMHDEQLSRKVTAVVVAHAMVMECVEQAVQVAHKHADEVSAATARATGVVTERHGSGSKPAPACCCIM